MLLRGTDRAAFAVAFAARVRRAGLQAVITETDDLVRALEADPPTSRSALYWTARVTLVRRHGDLAVVSMFPRFAVRSRRRWSLLLSDCSGTAASKTWKRWAAVLGRWSAMVGSGSSRGWVWSIRH